MIHYTCDRCQRSIQVEHELRYEIRIEVQPVVETDLDVECSDDRDHLLELDEMLETESLSCDDPAEEACVEQVELEHRFDLCPECFANYVKNPLGRDSQVQLGFSEN